MDAICIPSHSSQPVMAGSVLEAGMGWKFPYMLNPERLEPQHNMFIDILAALVSRVDTNNYLCLHSYFPSIIASKLNLAI
jgi:hypothetical protein